MRMRPSRHLAALLNASILSAAMCLGACEQSGPLDTSSDERGDLLDQVPAGQTSVGLELAFVNQFGFALWQKGALRADFDESILKDKLDGELRFLQQLNLWLDVSGEANLPPVFDTRDGAITLSVGEIQIDIRGGTDIGQLAATAVVAVEADVAFHLERGVLRMTPSFDPRDIHIDLRVQAFAGLKGEAIERIVLGIAPGYVEALLARLSKLPVPRVDLARNGINRIVGLDEATVKLSPDGAIMTGTLSDIDPNAVFASTSFEPSPVQESAPALAQCTAPSSSEPGLEGDCCAADDGSPGVCTNLDPDADGQEEAFCPTGSTALRRKCPSAPGHVKCCIYPE